jgi:hypothetical protein
MTPTQARHLSRAPAKPGLGSRASPGKWFGYPNLAQRPPAPARGAGYVQKMVRRALWALGTASTSQVLEWTRCRGPVRHCDYRAARRALEQIGAERMGRAKTIGRPWLWHLRESDMLAT